MGKKHEKVEMYRLGTIQGKFCVILMSGDTFRDFKGNFCKIFKSYSQISKVKKFE
jgi:predicted secreted acid phosphatase